MRETDALVHRTVQEQDLSAGAGIHRFSRRGCEARTVSSEKKSRLDRWKASHENRVPWLIEGHEVAAEVAKAARLEVGIDFAYPPGVNKDQYDAQTYLEGGGDEADAAAARMDAQKDAAKDITEMFLLAGLGDNVSLVCNHSNCEWSMPFVMGIEVNKVFQEMTQHAFTNHGRPMVAADEERRCGGCGEPLTRPELHGPGVCV